MLIYKISGILCRMKRLSYIKLLLDCRQKLGHKVQRRSDNYVLKYIRERINILIGNADSTWGLVVIVHLETLYSISYFVHDIASHRDFVKIFTRELLHWDFLVDREFHWFKTFVGNEENIELYAWNIIYIHIHKFPCNIVTFRL